MPQELDDWQDIGIDDWQEISTPSQGMLGSAWNWANKSWLPDRNTVPEFQETLRGFGVPETAIDYASYIPRFGDWMYSRVAQPTFTPLGAATLPLAGLRAGRIGLAAMGTGFGVHGLTEAVPRAYNDPSMENVLDVGMQGLMAGSIPLGMKAGAFSKGAKPAPPIESQPPLRSSFIEPKEQPLLPGMEEFSKYEPADISGVRQIPLGIGEPEQLGLDLQNRPFHRTTGPLWTDWDPTPQLPYNPEFSFQGVPRSSPFEVGRPLPPTPEITPSVPQLPEALKPFVQPAPEVIPERAVEPGPIPEGHVAATDIVPIKTVNVTQEVLQNMKNNGYDIDQQATTPKITVFKKVRDAIEGLLDDEEGGSRIYDEVVDWLTTRLNRIPTPQEIWAEIGKRREQINPVEVSGRTAQFQRRMGEFEESPYGPERVGFEEFPDDIRPNAETLSFPNRERLSDETTFRQDLEAGDPWSETFKDTVKRLITDEEGSSPFLDNITERISRIFNSPRFNRSRFNAAEINDALRRALGREPTENEVQIYTNAAIRASEAVQQELPGTSGYFPESQIPREYRTYDKKASAMRSADEIAKRLEEARRLETVEGNIEGARDLRAQAQVDRRSAKFYDPNFGKADEYRALARIREKAGDMESATRLRDKADRITAEDAGQLLLDFVGKKKKQGVEIDPIKLKEYLDSAPAQDASTGLSHSYAERELGYLKVDPDKKGLTIEPAGWGTTEVTYRNPQGKPIAHASFYYDGSKRKGYTTTLVADKNAGVLYGRALKAIGKVILDNDAARPSGIYSTHTAGLIKRLVEFAKSDEGFLDISALGEKWESVKRGMRTVANHLAEVYKDEGGWWDPAAGWDEIKKRTGWGQGVSKAVNQKNREANFIKEALAVPTNLTTTMDLSAPGRQGMSQILTPQFWIAAGKMFQGLSPEGFKRIDRELQNKPIFTRPIDPTTGKMGKSFAEQAGVKLFRPASEIGPRAEGVASRWLETGGNLPVLSAAWRNTAGVPIRMSNRAYITFLNHLNANRFEFLLNRARDMSMEAVNTGRAPMPGIMGGVQLPEFMGGGNIGFKKNYSMQEARDLNPYRNMVLAKEIADFVNTATGHGPLKTHLLPFKQAEINLQKHGDLMGKIFFSPGLMASRVRMLNPNTYAMASPFVRKQYAKAAIGAAAGWFAATELLKNAAGGESDEVSVNNDPLNADFGKVRIGNTRLDAGGGFLQFLVAYSRALRGGYTSSATGDFHEFGEGYQAPTQGEYGQRFLANKLNPTAKFAYDVMFASEYNPFHVKDRLMQMAVPLFIQDVTELAKENPELLPFAVPMMFGMGTQTYDKGESVSKFFEPENDILLQGGEGFNPLGWDWTSQGYD